MLQSMLERLRLDNVTPGLVAHLVHSNMRRAFRPRPAEQVVLGIVGCQRSGTSAMSRMFFRDFDCVVYREKSVLTGGPEGLRYRPFPEVAKIVSRKNASLIVFKMLVESQRTIDFLESIPNSKALWLFRNYRDVAASNLKKFGVDNGVRDIQHFLRPELEDWRSERATSRTIAIVRQHFSGTMNPNDAAALFWYARNQLFFDQFLNTNPRVLALEYESFVRDPSSYSKRIYDFAGMRYPGDATAIEISARSVRKGKELELSPEIDQLCADTLARLQEAAVPA